MEAHEIEAQMKEIETLKTQLADALKGGGIDSEELTRLREEKKELIDGRDKAKEAKRLEEEKRLTDNAEFKTLSEQLTAERDDLTKRLEGLIGKVEEYTKRDEAKLQTLIELIPENLRETVTGLTGSLSERIDLAEKLATVKPTAPNARPGGDGHNVTLQDEYDTAVKNGNVALQISLKRQLYEKKE